MNRCVPRKRALLALAASLSFPLALSLLMPLPAAAQFTVVRQAPKGVVLGKMTVVGGQSIEMDGKPDRLSPGSQIRGLNNLIVLPGTLTGQTVPVVYRREVTTGMVHEVWLLTDDEYRQLAKTNPGTGSDGVQQFLDVLAALWGARR